MLAVVLYLILQIKNGFLDVLQGNNVYFLKSKVNKRLVLAPLKVNDGTDTIRFEELHFKYCFEGGKTSMSNTLVLQNRAAGMSQWSH